MRNKALFALCIAIGAGCLSARLALAQPNAIVEQCGQGNDPGALIKACSMVIHARGDVPETSWAYNNRGNGHSYLGEFELAIADYTAALKLDPENADAHKNRGDAYYELGDLSLALTDYDTAVALGPETAEYYNSRGITRAGLGDLNGAIDDFTSAVRFNDQFVEAYQNRGNAFLMIGENEQAIQDLRTAMGISPDDPYVLNSLAWALYLNGNPDEALPFAQRSVEALAEAFNIDTLGHVLAALGRWEEAVTQFDRAMALGGAPQILQYQQALVDQGYLSSAAATGELNDQTETALAACLQDGCRLVE